MCLQRSWPSTAPVTASVATDADLARPIQPLAEIMAVGRGQGRNTLRHTKTAPPVRCVGAVGKASAFENLVAVWVRAEAAPSVELEVPEGHVEVIYPQLDQDDWTVTPIAPGRIRVAAGAETPMPESCESPAKLLPANGSNSISGGAAGPGGEERR